MTEDDERPARAASTAGTTTIRAGVTAAEHEAIRRSAKRMGMTINELVRAAVWGYIAEARGATVERLIETAAGEPYQPMLFDA